MLRQAHEIGPIQRLYRTISYLAPAFSECQVLRPPSSLRCHVGRRHVVAATVRPRAVLGEDSRDRERGRRMKISHDFKEFIECANAHDVRFLIVGGYAVAFYGHPRYTKDPDVWIDSSPDNAIRLLEALGAFGFERAPPRSGRFGESRVIVARPPARPRPRGDELKKADRRSHERPARRSAGFSTSCS